jgi:hypothetical protein
MTDTSDQFGPRTHAPVPSICLVIPYFGKWPFWLPFFLKSCGQNPSIAWHLHTDCGIPANVPSNVRITETSYAQYCARVSKALDIDFTPDNPYKLCDLKPALGFVHQDELKAFDLWGFGDIDVVYGDIRRYFTTERLAGNDVFSTHRRRISGHFCLLRNNATMREAFMSVPEWQKLLSSKQHVAFDESAFSRLFVRHKNWPGWLAELAKPLNRWTRRTENKEAFSTPNAGVAWHDGTKDFPDAWFWNTGRLTNSRDGDREYPYLHFMAWKQKEWPANGLSWTSALDDVLASNSWQISARGFSALA